MHCLTDYCARQTFAPAVQTFAVVVSKWRFRLGVSASRLSSATAAGPHRPSVSPASGTARMPSVSPLRYHQQEGLTNNLDTENFVQDVGVRETSQLQTAVEEALLGLASGQVDIAMFFMGLTQTQMRLCSLVFNLFANTCPAQCRVFLAALLTVLSSLLASCIDGLTQISPTWCSLCCAAHCVCPSSTKLASSPTSKCQTLGKEQRSVTQRFPPLPVHAHQKKCVKQAKKTSKE